MSECEHDEDYIDGLADDSERFGRAIEILTAAEALFEALDPRESELSPAEVASLFNATREQIRVFLNLYR